MSVITTRAGISASAPLGSLTQTSTVYCEKCDSSRITKLHMHLGGFIQFTACRDCGDKNWAGENGRMTIHDVFALVKKR